MKIAGFSAQADLVGRRVRLRWEFVPEDGESVVSIPQVTVRRKLRDFDYPKIQGLDPFLVYNSNGFPPADGSKVTELNDWETHEGDERTAWSALSLSRQVGGREVEVLRRGVGVVYGSDGAPLRQVVELVDLGGMPGALVPGQTYYYQLFSDALADEKDPTPYRATALVTEAYGHNRTLYELLPEIYRRHDVQTRPNPDEPGTASLPEMSPRAGQLRRFMDLFGIALDSMRSSAEGLRTLHDLDHVDYRYLPLLARWIGWDLSYDVDVPLQRNELKSASLLFRGVGTVPNLRALVSHYTGWFTQVAEFSQHLLKTNEAPQLNLYWATADGGGWRGVDDASTVLGFGPGKRDALGGPLARATLVGTASEPFALRPGMELTLSADGGLPASVRFEPGDFADMGRATAVEVADAMNRVLYEITVKEDGGRISLSSNAIGPQSSLRIEPAPTSLLSLEGGPGGRLSTFVDGGGALRLFYEASLPMASSDGPGVRQVRYKTFTGGRWRGSRSLDPRGAAPEVPQGSPAVAELLDGRILLFYIENPDTAASHLRVLLGQPEARVPARLLTTRRQPFSLREGAVLVLTGSFGSEQWVVRKEDFANLQSAKAQEVATAMNAQLIHVRASAPGDGSLALETVKGGPNAWLRLDLQRSNTARALGFDPRSSSATGQWDDSISWTVLTGPAIPAGRIAGLCAVSDSNKGVWLFYSAHANGLWRIFGTRYQPGGQVSEEARVIGRGVGQPLKPVKFSWTAPVALADGGGGNCEPCAALDQKGRIHLLYSQRQGVGTSEDIWRLRYRRLEGSTWTQEGLPYSLAMEDTGSDREPGAVWLPNVGLSVFFRSNRAGGQSLWSFTLQEPFAPATQLTPRPDEASNEVWPAPVLLDGQLSLLYRSDRNVALSQAGSAPMSVATGHSVRTPDAGTLRRYAGSVSTALGDLVRARGRRLWGDLYAYTPQRPDGLPLTDEEFYTPNTIGLYVSRGRYGSPLTPKEAERLRQLLARLLPFHLRAVLIVLAGSDTEYVYKPDEGVDIQSAWRDVHPFLETYGGARDETAVALPGWVVLRSTVKEDVSADPAKPDTLQRRTFYKKPL